MLAFVTGSTGLLGSNLVNELLAAGHRVRALARDPQKVSLLPKHPNLEVVAGDMEDVAGFAHHLDGVDWLFHVAAYFRESFDSGDHWPKLQRINIDGTLQLLTEADRRGVKKAVYVSSSGVMDDERTTGQFDETAPLRPTDYRENLYFRSKVIAELEVDKWQPQHRLPVVLVRPVGILGPQDSGPTTMGRAIFTVMNGGFPIVPPGGFTFVDARDAARAMIKAAECGAAGERYVLAEGYHTMRELVEAVHAAGGPRPPAITPPLPVMMGIAAMAALGARLRGQTPQLTPSVIRLMQNPRVAISAKAQRDLGATFRPFRQTIADMVAWYRTHPLKD